MNRIFSIQFNLGVAGIISSIIWIMVKFGLINLTANEWVSISLLIFSFAAFYYYLSLGIDKFLLASIISFFFSIVFLIYSFSISTLNNRLKLSFELLYYAFAFALASFFLIKSFYKNTKIYFLIFIALFISTLLFFLVFKYLLPILESSKAFYIILKMNDVKRYLISFCLISLLYFPIRNIISEIRNMN
ncbi:MAG: hypothetical protein NUV92_00100 [Ignavibacteria bacterium]|jgi:hypothetical protein|nr:hypothetical protein [Ignavibacteria bacterium]MDH7528869.1 hypothetical protein [Ignavibacteria bacterium]